MAKAPSKQDYQELAYLASVNVHGKIDNDDKTALQALANKQDEALRHAISMNKSIQSTALRSVLTHGHLFAQSKTQLQKIADVLQSTTNNFAQKNQSKDNDVTPSTTNTKKM